MAKGVAFFSKDNTSSEIDIYYDDKNTLRNDTSRSMQYKLILEIVITY